MLDKDLKKWYDEVVKVFRREVDVLRETIRDFEKKFDNVNRLVRKTDEKNKFEVEKLCVKFELLKKKDVDQCCIIELEVFVKCFEVFIDEYEKFFIVARYTYKDEIEEKEVCINEFEFECQCLEIVISEYEILFELVRSLFFG